MLLPIVGIYILGIPVGSQGHEINAIFVRFLSVFVHLQLAHPVRPSCSEQPERDYGDFLLTADKEKHKVIIWIVIPVVSL